MPISDNSMKGYRTLRKGYGLFLTREKARKRSTGLINREVLLPRIIVDYKLLVKVEGETGKRAVAVSITCC